MYFVVYLTKPKWFTVIPCSWIHGEKDILWDKFVNSGLNSSQTYLCYWASKNGSIEYSGAPNVQIEPNFQAILSTRFPVAEGTFFCRIVHFKGNIRDFFFFSFSYGLLLFAVEYALALDYCLR